MGQRGGSKHHPGHVNLGAPAPTPRTPRPLQRSERMKINFGDSLYGGFALGSMAPDAEDRLLADNDARMRRLYPGPLYDDLILLRRRGYVVVPLSEPLIAR